MFGSFVPTYAKLLLLLLMGLLQRDMAIKVNRKISEFIYIIIAE
jgi:hypothetical protein